VTTGPISQVDFRHERPPAGFKIRAKRPRWLLDGTVQCEAALAASSLASLPKGNPPRGARVAGFHARPFVSIAMKREGGSVRQTDEAGERSGLRAVFFPSAGRTAPWAPHGPEAPSGATVLPLSSPDGPRGDSEAARDSRQP
jgi:hypothetical protein